MSASTFWGGIFYETEKHGFQRKIRHINPKIWKKEHWEFEQKIRVYPTFSEHTEHGFSKIQYTPQLYLPFHFPLVAPPPWTPDPRGR